jgi:hypothetical protein
MKLATGTAGTGAVTGIILEAEAEPRAFVLDRHRHARREQRSQNRWAIRLSAPRPPFSPAAASKPSRSPLLGPAQDRIIVTAFRSPATAAPLSASIPGSKFPACHF